MSLFGKNDDLTVWLEKVREKNYSGKEGLADLLAGIHGRQAEVQLSKHVWMLSHSERDVRAFAMELAVKQASNRSLSEVLVREIPGKSGQIRKEIAELVIKIDLDRIGLRIGTLANSPKREDREAGYELICAHPRWDEFLPSLKLGLHDPDQGIRHKAVRVLARGVKIPTVFLILKDLVHDEDEQVRQVAIHALAESNEPDIVEPFFQRLAIEADYERSVMVRALSKLARNPQAKLEERLIPILGDENPAVRDAAVALLAEMPNRTHVLRAFLLHSRGIAYWLRDRVTTSISKISKDIVEPLIELMNDPNEDVRVAAMQMAAQFRNPRIVPAVRKTFLSGEDWWVRVMAADILSQYPDREVVDLLVSKLNDAELRYGIVAALGAMNTPLAIPHLLQCLHDPQRGIRVITLDALKNVRDPVVVQAVLEVALKDPQQMLRDKAIVMLEHYGDIAEHALQMVANQNRHQEVPVPVISSGASTLEMQNDTLNLK